MNFFGSKVIINNKSIELLFGDTQNFLESFKNIHESYNDENFIDLKEISLSDFTNIYIKETKLSIDDIKNNNCILKRYIKKAKLETNATLAEISDFLGVSASRIGYHSRK